MTRPLTRRIAASAAAAAIVAGGLGMGAGTAAAAGTGSLGSLGSLGTGGAGDAAAADNNNGFAPEAGKTYPKAATAASERISFTREVLNGGTVAPGGKVTYRTTFSVTTGIDAFLNKVVDIPPSPGFTYVAGSATAAGKKVDTVIDASNGAVTMTGSGWRLSKNTGDTVAFEVTYKAPSNLTIGNVYNSGIVFKPTTWNTDQEFRNVGAWATARAANPGEAITGSLDSSGFGSSGPVASGSAASSIINNPAGFIGDIIGNVLKSAS